MILPHHSMILPYPLEEFTPKEHYTSASPAQQKNIHLQFEG
jgi:hypothetical protein